MARAGTALLAIVLVMAGASAARAQSDEGSVLLPTATPGFARTLHDIEGLNGLTGYVIHGDLVHEGRRYTLTKTDGTDLVNLDVYFYEDIRDEQACDPSPSEDDGNGGESGRILCDAEWAIVVLLTGFDAEFRLTW